MSEPEPEEFAGASKMMEQLKQEHAIAQIISAMPSNIDGQPDITVAAPIRPKWAHKLYQAGLRFHPELATHRVVVHSGIAGPHAPREFQKIDENKLLAIIQKQNPGLYKKIQAAQRDHHGGDEAVSKILKTIADRLPQEWIERLGPDLAAKVDDFAADNVPDPEPPDDTA